MKILITGGAGFIGSHMAESFLAKGWSVTVLDNFSSGRRENLSHISANIEIIEGDIRDKAAVARAISGSSAVVHLAALASVPASFLNPEETYEVNFTGTRNILEAALQNKVKRVTFASSSAVYGDTELLPVTEETPDNPLSPYGLSKLLGEKLCRFYNTAFGLPVTVFRFFNVYGPRQNPFSEYSAVIPKFLSIIKEGGTPVIFGNGEQTRDFIYISDLVKAHMLAITGTEDADTHGFNRETQSLTERTEEDADTHGFNRETQSLTERTEEDADTHGFNRETQSLTERTEEDADTHGFNRETQSLTERTEEDADTHGFNRETQRTDLNPLRENPSNQRASAFAKPDLCENPSNQRASAFAKPDLRENPSNQRASAFAKPDLRENPSNQRVSASPLNLGSGTAYSLNDLVKVISETLGRAVKPAFTEARSGDILHSFCKIDKINTELTFKPEVSLHSGIAKMLNYYNFQS